MTKQLGGNGEVPSFQNAGSRMSFLPGWLTGWLSGSTNLSNLVVPESDPVLKNRNIINSNVSGVPDTYPYSTIGGGKKHNVKKSKTRKNSKLRKIVRKKTLKVKV